MRRSNRMKWLEAREQEREEVHDKIDAELHTVGLQRFGQAIAQSMELIEVLAARFNNDSRMIRRICLEVLDRIASRSRTVRLATLTIDPARPRVPSAYSVRRVVTPFVVCLATTDLRA